MAGSARNRELENKIVDLRIEGYTPNEIEKKLNLKPNVVYFYLKKDDLPLRIREGRDKRVRDRLYINAVKSNSKADDIKLYEQIERGWNPSHKVKMDGNLDINISADNIAKKILDTKRKMKEKESKDNDDIDI
jgi:hypothetical protein